MVDNMNSNKIGVLTFHRTNNFGSQLQAFALYSAIEDLGYPCEIIDYRCPAIENREFKKPRTKISSLKQLVKAMLLNPTLHIKSDHMQRFLSDNAKVSCPYTPDTIHRANTQYGKFMVGSDIVWGVDITESDFTYFLDFVQDSKKKFAFASSVGNSELGIQEENIASLLSEFSQICVRESDAVNWVKRLSGKDASLVCDPTMLLPAQSWDAYVPPKKYKKGYVLVYFNNDDGKCLADAVRYAKKHGLKVYHIHYNMPTKGIVRVRPKTLQEFLGLIKNAEAVFTASYHGMLFSTYYERELFFYTRCHKERMLSLAEKISIMGRCCDQQDVFQVKPMDYAKIKVKTDLFRQQSMECLKKELENA